MGSWTRKVEAEMRKNRLAGIALSVTAGVALVGACGSGGSDNSSSGGASSKTVALLLPESKTARYESKDRPDFTAKLKELCPGCTLLYYNADQDPAKQQQQVEAAITKGAGVLVLDPVDAASAASSVARAKQSKIPVISYSRLITNAKVDYFVSNDNEQVGVMQATALLEALQKAGKTNPRVVMINGSPQDSAAGDFKRGAHTVLDGKAKLVAEYDTPDWSPDKAQTEMDQALSKLGKEGFDAVYAANDGTAGGAIASLKAAGVDPTSKFVTGQDAELAAVQRIVAGQQFMTVYKKIKPQAEAAAELAAALARGTQPPATLINAQTDNGAGKVPSVFTPMVVVTRDAVQKEIIDDQWWSAAQVCTGTYAAACQTVGIK
jgi:D-xylose transport system substrate-binding protein